MRSDSHTYTRASLPGFTTGKFVRRRRKVSRRQRLHVIVSCAVVFYMLFTPALAGRGALSPGAAQPLIANAAADPKLTNIPKSQDKTGNSPQVSGDKQSPSNALGVPYSTTPVGSPSIQPTTYSSATAVPTATSTSIGSPTVTDTSTPIENTPPPTYTVGIPTAAPTLTPIPDTDYEDHAIDQARDGMLAQISALQALTSTITGTLVSGLTGGRITSQDGGLQIGMLPGVVPVTDTINVSITRMTFPQGDPRATRNGYPLAYTYELTATRPLNGQGVSRFNKEVGLVWNIDPAELAAAGVHGFPLRVYTFDEQNQAWMEIPSQWNAQTNQLTATTPHFSIYSVGDGFDKISNYIPNVNNYGVDLQSGAATVNYPINAPAGPGGFGPKIALSYNSRNVDRIDATQQGTSPIGWGWSLSSSYIAATQHAFSTYNPWTASIVADGVNGDLTLGSDGYWHTNDESFARIQYYTGTLPYPRQTDHWEAWGKDGTHYIFDKQALINDTSNTPSAYTTNKWMLSSATDVHGNVISYSYKYQNTTGNCTSDPSTSPCLQDTPIVNNLTRAVYLYQVTYGYNTSPSADNVDKLQIDFGLSLRLDISSNDTSNKIYQSYKIDRIDVKRKQQVTSGCSVVFANNYCLLRRYDLVQDYSISLPSFSSNYSHLTLNEIIPKGNDGTTRLPGTTFVYWSSSSIPVQEDWGHLWSSSNGYGGTVSFYYDAVGGDAYSKYYRRVRAKKICDGIADSGPTATATPPHLVTYYYDYRGAAVNDLKHSDAAAQTVKPLYIADKEFRGFAWAREQDPLGQVTDHYFSQDDTYQTKEWRVQVGKADILVDPMDGTPTPNSTWTVSGPVTQVEDPALVGNNVWRVPIVTSTGTPISTVVTSIARNAGVSDGADVSMRFQIVPSSAGTPDPNYRFTGSWKLENASGNGEYFGVEISRTSVGSNYELHATVKWSVGGTSGTRDLYQTNLTPRLSAQYDANQWYWVRLHTSPDGRFAVELHNDDYQTYTGTQRLSNNFSHYILIKSSDAASTGGANGKIPSMPTGQTWKFKHEVTSTTAGFADFATLIDDYSERRTVYSQSDSVYANQPPISATTPDFTHWEVGATNNCNNMSIRYAPLTESWSAIYGTGTQLGQTKRTKTAYVYDSYGNQTQALQYGDVDVSGDERTTETIYIAYTPSLTPDYVVDKPCYTKIWSGLLGTPIPAPVVRSWTRFHYGTAYTYSCTFSSNFNGDVTQTEQIGVTSQGADDGTRSKQQVGYDVYGNQIWAMDPNQVDNSSLGRTDTAYDGYYHSFVAYVTYPNGRSDTNVYFDFTKDVVTRHTDVNGTATEMRYDVFGRPTKSWIEGFDDSTYPTEQYVFSDLGQATVTPPFYISVDQRLQSGTTQLTWATRWFDGRGRVVEDVTPYGADAIVVSSGYTDTGQIYTTTLPYTVPNSGRYTYATPIANLPSITKYYDGAGRITMAVNPDNTHVIYDYSLLQWTATVDESGHYKWQRTDMLGRLDLIQEDDRNYTGTATPTPTPMTLAYTSYGYDLLDHLTKVTRDASGMKTATDISYNGLGRKIQTIDPDMGTWQYEYDSAGNLTKQKDALFLSNPNTYKDHQVFFQYDAMNRPTKKYYGASHYGDGTNGTPDVRYYYDNDLGDAAAKKSWGRLRAAEVTLQGQGASLANGHGYEYDARGRTVAEVITTTNASPTRTYTVGYTYDTADRLTSLTYPDPDATHEQVTVSYNALGIGLPIQLISSKTGGHYPVRDASYNVRGQLTSLTQGSPGQFAPSGGGKYSPDATDTLLTTNFIYDDYSTQRGWLTGINVTTSDTNNVLLNLNMGYAPNGNIVSVGQTSTSGSSPAFANSFEYDGLDRLRRAASSITGGGSLFPTEKYDFDTLGRMTVRTIGGTPSNYTYGDSAHKDAPTAYGSNSYSYDANGNQTTGTVNGTSQTRTFDPENRLSQVVAGSVTTSFVYDANGQRLIKSVSDTSGGLGSQTKTLYIGNLYEEDITNGSTGSSPYTSYYSLGSKLVGMRRYNQAAGNGQYRIVGDHLGSTTLVVDTSSPPQVVQRQYSKPYGETAWQYTASSSLTSVGYTGQRRDDSSGLMFYNARYYDPKLSYFLSADNIAPDPQEPKTRNRYGYVAFNPLTYSDPTGHCKDDPAQAADGNTCASATQKLDKFGIKVYKPSDWTLEELLQVIESIELMMSKFGWSLEDFRWAMGIDNYDDRGRLVSGSSIYLARNISGSGQAGGAYYCSVCSDADKPAGLAGQRVLLIYGRHDVFTGSDQSSDIMRLGEIVVHELAHGWDDAYRGSLSERMALRTGSSIQGSYYYAGGDAASEYGGSGLTSTRHGPREDWAEAVAAYVYGDRDRYQPSWPNGHTGMDGTRRSFVSNAIGMAHRRQRYFGPDWP